MLCPDGAPESCAVILISHALTHHVLLGHVEATSAVWHITDTDVLITLLPSVAPSSVC